jgi:3-methyladenine DNA glycosylase/8-oxoguanine DNA glycosylase
VTSTSRPTPEVRAEVVPPGPYRLPGSSPDGLRRLRGGVLFRYVRRDGRDVLLRATRLRDGRVVLGASAVGDDATATRDPRATLTGALADWRRALGCDVDLRPFVAAHRHDPLIGPSVRRRPWLQPVGRLSVFEAVQTAIAEQLIAYADAVVIQRRIAGRHGPVLAPVRPGHPRLRDLPDAATVAERLIPAHFEACGLAPSRAACLHRAAREIAAARIEVDDRADPDRVLTRLRRISGIGSWTIALVDAQAHGRLDRAPSGDLNLRKALGRIRSGDPRARVDEAEVDAWLAPYAPWGALAAAHVMQTRPDVLPRVDVRTPVAS